MNTVTILLPGEFSITFLMASQNSYEADLEGLFAEWNHGSRMESELCKQSRVRSFSVNDFICINDNWWQCASIGWRPVTKEFVDKIEAEVRSHPAMKEHRSWFALHEVMRNYKFGLQSNVDDKPVTV